MRNARSRAFVPWTSILDFTLHLAVEPDENLVCSPITSPLVCVLVLANTPAVLNIVHGASRAPRGSQIGLRPNFGRSPDRDTCRRGRESARAGVPMSLTCIAHLVDRDGLSLYRTAVARLLPPAANRDGREQHDMVLPDESIGKPDGITNHCPSVPDPRSGAGSAGSAWGLQPRCLVGVVYTKRGQ